MAFVESNKKIFLDTGVLHLPGLVPRSVTSRAKTYIINELARHKIKVGPKLSSSGIQSLPVFQQTIQLGKMIEPSITLNQLFCDSLFSWVQGLVSNRLIKTPPVSQILLSLPQKKVWSLSHLNWHLDLAVPQKECIPGIQAFILIDDVQPRGGATLALKGSHRLNYIRQGYNAHQMLKTKSDFAANPEKFFQPQLIESVPVQILEMSGKAGDVYLMDLRVLHSPSINSRQNLRMMATSRFFVINEN